MNKLKYLAILMCLLLTSAALTRGQDLTSQQKRERCENNKNRLAELVSQATSLEDGLESYAFPERMVFARNRSNELSNALLNTAAFKKAVDSFGSTVETRKEWADRASLPWREEFAKDDRLYIRELRDAMGRKYDKGVYTSKHKTEVENQLAALKQQIASHHQRLAELGCNDQRTEELKDEKPKSGCQGFAGTWKTGFGEMTFTITDNIATASYSFDSGSVKGQISDGGRVMSGNYSENEAKGTFQFVLADDGRSFSGRWQRTSGKREPPSGTWDGKCIRP